MQVTLGSYAYVVNRRRGLTGSLFAQNTHAKPLENADQHYPQLCFHYIHRNPVRAGLVRQPEAWPYSSLPDYAGARKGTFYNQTLARRLLDLSPSPQPSVQDAHLYSAATLKALF